MCPISRFLKGGSGMSITAQAKSRTALPDARQEAATGAKIVYARDKEA